MAGIKQNGGTVSNPVGKTISGYLYGVDIYGGKGSVTNSGSISETGKYGIGVDLLDGGSVTNHLNGTIAGFTALEVSGAYGRLVNSGVITGSNAGNASGVSFRDGGKVVNEKGGKIYGPGGGVYILGSTGTVINSGSITNSVAGEPGVFLEAGGVVTNKLGGVITSVYINGGKGTIVNSGSIKGLADQHQGIKGLTGNLNGVVLTGGTLTNHATGQITGYDGIVIGKASGTVINAGVITGTAVVANTEGGTTFETGDGIAFFKVGGSVTNQAGGSINGAHYGVYITGGAGTVTNAGTITGKTTAIDFAGAGANTLTLETGSVLTGSVLGSTATSATNALVLKGHGAANNVFLDFDTLSVHAKGTWKLGGGSTFAKTTVSSGTLDLTGAVTGTAKDTISGAATLEFGSSVADTQTIHFTGSGGMLDLGSPSGFSGVIRGFDSIGKNDAVELLGIWEISGFTRTTATEGTLTLKDGNESASLVFDGSYSEALFHAKSGAGSTTITYR